MSSSKTVGNNSPSGYEWEYARKDLGNTKWQNIKLCFYNPENGEVLGRTPKSWGGIFLFYCVFYSILACLFAICMYVLMATLTDEYPKLQLDESIIGVNPGLGFRPMPQDAEAGALIWYKASDNESIQVWIDEIDEFLEDYKHPENLAGGGINRMPCDYNNYPMLGKVCEIEIEKSMGPCVSDFRYGFPQAKPCIFIKLNKIYGWEPEYYESVDELPAEMPVTLKSFITHAVSKNESHFETVWVSCQGADVHDNENIGDIDYFPLPGYPGYFYPYVNTIGYLSPIIAIRFRNPRLHTVINIECRAWAKNIHYKKSGLNREGSVHFEIFID